MAPMTNRELRFELEQYEKLDKEKVSLRELTAKYDQTFAMYKKSEAELTKLQDETTAQEGVIQSSNVEIQKCEKPTGCNACMNGIWKCLGCGSPEERAAKARKDIETAKNRLEKLPAEKDEARQRLAEDEKPYLECKNARDRAAEIDTQKESIFNKVVTEKATVEMDRLDKERKDLTEDITEDDKKIKAVEASLGHFQSAREHAMKAITECRDLETMPADEAAKPGETPDEQANRLQRNDKKRKRRENACQDGASAVKEFNEGMAAPKSKCVEAEVAGLGICEPLHNAWTSNLGKNVEEMKNAHTLATKQFEIANNVLVPLRSEKDSCEKKLSEVENQLKHAQQERFAELLQAIVAGQEVSELDKHRQKAPEVTEVTKVRKGGQKGTIFMSWRMCECKPQVLALQAALEKMGVDVVVVNEQSGNSLLKAIGDGLKTCHLVVIMGTKTYGKETSGLIDTNKELNYVLEKRKPYFLLKMCDAFEEDTTALRINFSTTAYVEWKDGTDMDPKLVNKIVEKLETVRKAGM